MNNDEPHSEWIKERQADAALAAAEAEVARQKHFAKQQLIDGQRQPFWAQMLEQLRKDTRGISALGLLGRYQENFGDSVRITVTRPGTAYGQVFTDLCLGPRHIQCTGLDIGFYNLLFCAVSDDEIAVVSEQNPGPPMSAAKTAQYVLERMVDHLGFMAR